MHMHPPFMNRSSLLESLKFLTIIAATVILFAQIANIWTTVQFTSARSTSHKNVNSIDSLQPSERINRPYTKSNDSELMQILSEETDFKQALRIIQDHVAYVEQQTSTVIKKEEAPRPDQPLLPCQYSGDWRFRAAVRSHFKRRNLEVPDTTCITELEGVHTLAPDDNDAPNDELTVFDAIVTRASVLYNRRKDIVKQLGLSWKEPDVLFQFPYNRTSQRCVIHPLGAIRPEFTETWYTDTRITNAPTLQHLPEGERLHLSEYLRVGDDNKFSPSLVFEALQERHEEKSQFQPKTNSTTYFTDYPSHPTPSVFQVMNAQDNAALQAAIDKSDIYVQQVEDALTPSSVAILFLPLALTLVPIASLAPVTTAAMLLYTLISDVLTAVPLAIKGVELMIIGNQRHRAVVIRLTGSVNGSLLVSAGADITAAECRALSFVRPTGIKFLATAIFFMVFGVVLELVARNIRMRRDFRRQAWDGMATALLIENQRGLGFA